jgi:hypothetical protein
MIHQYKPVCLSVSVLDVNSTSGEFPTYYINRFRSRDIDPQVQVFIR